MAPASTSLSSRSRSNSTSAVPVALLATEAITNAIKHGTRDDGSPIAVTLHRDCGQVVLQVTNDGGTTATRMERSGLGRRIMTALAQQIDGQWSLEATGTGRHLLQARVACLRW